MPETPARHLTTAQLQRELTRLEGQGGSPGEWMLERMGEIERELKRRDREFRAERGLRCVRSR